MAAALASPSAVTLRPAMRRLFNFLLLLLLASITFLHYREYNAELNAHPETYSLLLHGNGAAPAQYRVGMVFAAEALHRLTRAPIYSFLALFDFALALGAALLLRDLLTRMGGFQTASPASRWSRCLLFLLLLSLYLAWSGYYQRPETFACTFFVAASVYLLSWKRPAAIVVPCLLVLAVLQGFVRADVAILFHFGLLVYLLTIGGRGFPLSRPVLLLTSLVGTALPAAILYVLIHKIFPHATYGDTPMFQLILNLRPTILVPFALFIIPTLYTYKQAIPRLSRLPAPFSALLLIAFFYFGSWALLGRLEEMRIFIPFAVAMMPLTVNFLMDTVDLELP